MIIGNVVHVLSQMDKKTIKKIQYQEYTTSLDDINLKGHKGVGSYESNHLLRITWFISCSLQTAPCTLEDMGWFMNTRSQ